MPVWGSPLAQDVPKIHRKTLIALSRESCPAQIKLLARVASTNSYLNAPPNDLPGWQHWLQELLEEARPVSELAARHASKATDGELQRWVDLLRTQIYD